MSLTVGHVAGMGEWLIVGNGGNVTGGQWTVIGQSDNVVTALLMESGMGQGEGTG